MASIRRVTPFLATRDLTTTVAFYKDHLGFRVAALHPPEAPTMAILSAGDAEKGGSAAEVIFEATLWPGPTSMTGQIVLDLGPQGRGSSRVDALANALRGHTTIEWGPEVFGYGRRECSVRDPNGYSLVLSEETDDAPTCSGERAS